VCAVFLNVIHVIVVDLTVKLDSVYGAMTFSTMVTSRMLTNGDAE
jgi:hypothetical protein